MNDIRIVLLAPKIGDSLRCMSVIYSGLRSGVEAGQDRVSCVENADFEVYLSPEYRGNPERMFPLTSTLDIGFKKTQIGVRWSVVPNAFLTNRNRIGEAAEDCDLFLVCISCTAMNGPKEYVEGLKGVASVLNAAPRVPVRFVFLDADGVGNLSEILGRFGFTEGYRTRGTACTCMGEEEVLTRDLVVDLADILECRGEANWTVRGMRRKLLKSSQPGGAEE